jgi:hypothetical protein
MAARALVPVGEAHADGTDESVLVQMQYDSRPSGTRGGECTPAEGGLQIVRMHDPRAMRSNGVRHSVGIEPAAQ